VSRTAKATGAVEIYSYDSQNRLVGYASPTTTASYAYDALDRRIAKVVDGVVEAFVHDAWALRSTIASDVVLDFEGGALARRWLHSARVDEPLAFERYAGTTAGGSGAAREVFADRLGNVLSVADPATGVVSGTAVYDSFGGRTITGEAIRYGFTGREHDAESGLIHFRARAYDPATGQFLQRDPIGFAAGDLNLYAYVWNDPYGWTDPSGLASERMVMMAGGVGLIGAAGIAACATDEPCRDGMTGIGGGIFSAASAILAALSAPFHDLWNWMNSGDGEATDVTTEQDVPIDSLPPVNPGQGHQIPRPELENLTDEELLDTMRNPENGDRVTTKEGHDFLVDGNGRVSEARNRNLGKETIPVDRLGPGEPIAPWEE
jgi:RHS repeat-associated protein